jgi:hypothetical protein
LRKRNGTNGSPALTGSMNCNSEPASVICDAIAKAQAALADHVADHDSHAQFSANIACMRVLGELCALELWHAEVSPLPDGAAIIWLCDALRRARAALDTWSAGGASAEDTASDLLGILDDQTVIEAMTALGYPPKGVTA